MSTSTAITGKTVIDGIVSIDKGGGTMRSTPVYDEEGNSLIVTEDKWSMMIQLKESDVNEDSDRYYMTIDGYGLFKVIDDRSYLYRVINLPISEPDYKIIHCGMSYNGHAFWLITYNTVSGYRLWMYDREYKQLTQGSSGTPIPGLLNKDEGSLHLNTINYYDIQYHEVQRHKSIIPESTITQYVFIVIGNLTYLQLKMTFSSTYSETIIPLTGIEYNLKHIQSITDGKMNVTEYTSTTAPSSTETLNGEYITNLPYANGGTIRTSKRLWYPSNTTLYDAVECTSYTLWLYDGSKQPQNITESLAFKEFHGAQYTKSYGRLTIWVVDGGNILLGSSSGLDGYNTINIIDTGINSKNAYMCVIAFDCSYETGYNTPTFPASMDINDVNAALENATRYQVSLAAITTDAFYRIKFIHPTYYKHGTTSYTKLQPNINVTEAIKFSNDIGTIKIGFNNTFLHDDSTLGVFTDRGVITIDVNSPAEYVFQPLYYVNNSIINASIYWNYWGLIRIATGFISTVNGAVPIVMNVQGEINSSNINAYTQYFHKCMILIKDIQQRLAQLEAKS